MCAYSVVNTSRALSFTIFGHSPTFGTNVEFALLLFYERMNERKVHLIFVYFKHILF